MPLLQIGEPEERRPSARKFAVGIDLGTTNSLVAVVQDGGDGQDGQNSGGVILTDGGGRLLPSAVYYGEDGTAVVGDAALQHRWRDPQNTLTSVKRLMGRGRVDVGADYGYDYAAADGMVKIRTSAGDKSPVEVSADILRALRARALAATGEERIDGAVITVPAYFDDAQRQATRDAARLAGLPVLRLLNEPTAAAVAYGLDNAGEGTYVVYDLGGGTFDLSVLRLARGIFQVLATGGDTALGGDDYDRILAALAREKMKLGGLSAPDMLRLVAAAKEAKERLSAAGERTELRAALSSGDASCTVDAAEFSAAAAELTGKTIALCAGALRDAGVNKAEVDGVILVGGSTRLPLVRAAVADFFGQIPYDKLNPDEVVALGAAAQADVLIGNRRGGDGNRRENWLLLDVIPLSLGVETFGGLAEKIIHRNETLPVEKHQEFTTHQDGQSTMRIHVVQGERELVGDCRSLATFILSGIPPLTAGTARIRVSFRVDADGLLSVTATEKTGGARAGITVVPSYGLSEEEMQRMLQNAYENAEEDLNRRRLLEARREGEKTLQLLERFVTDKFLQEDERAPFAAAAEALRGALDGESAEKIDELCHAAQQTAAALAARRLNDDVAKTLAERQTDDS